MDELKDKIIKKVEMEEDQTIVFTTKDGEKIAYVAYGDCCSTSWFAHIAGLKNLLGQRIVEVKERQEWTKKEIATAEAEGDYESLSLYGYLLKTKKGTCDIEFRNESNGYYGGNAELSSVPSGKLKEIKKDF